MSNHFWRPKQTLLGGRGWFYHPCHPLLSTAFALKFSLLPLSFLVGSFLFFSHLRLYLIDKARIAPTEQHGWPHVRHRDRLCPGLAEARQIAPISLQKSQLSKAQEARELKNGVSPLQLGRQRGSCQRACEERTGSLHPPCPTEW